MYVTSNSPSAAAGAPRVGRRETFIDAHTPDAAVDELYRMHALGLIRLALLMVGDQTAAEDVVHDAFVGLYRGWARLRDPGKAARYLRVAVINGCRTVMRSRARGRSLRVQHDLPVWSAEAAAIADEDRRAVLAAVARLPRRQREVLALRYYLDLPESDIAASLRISRGTVSSTASRALAALARELRADELREGL